MAPNFKGAFLFNIAGENRNPEPCLSTLSRFRTWRPTGDSIMNQRTSHPKATSINFKLIRTWRTTLKSFLSKKTWEVPRPSRFKNLPSPKKNTITQKSGLRFFLSRNKRERILKRKHLAMSRSLLNQRHSLHVTWESKLWFFFTSQQIKHLLEEMCQKSKMDTTIDFVKHYSEK